MAKKASVSRVVIYKDAAGEYRWRGLAANNKIVSESGEGYVNKHYCRKMAKELFPLAVIEVH